MDSRSKQMWFDIWAVSQVYCFLLALVFSLTSSPSHAKAQKNLRRDELTFRELPKTHVTATKLGSQKVQLLTKTRIGQVLSTLLLEWLEISFNHFETLVEALFQVPKSITCKRYADCNPKAIWKRPLENPRDPKELHLDEYIKL